MWLRSKSRGCCMLKGGMLNSYYKNRFIFYNWARITDQPKQVYTIVYFYVVHFCILLVFTWYSVRFRRRSRLSFHVCFCFCFLVFFYQYRFRADFRFCLSVALSISFRFRFGFSFLFTCSFSFSFSFRSFCSGQSVHRGGGRFPVEHDAPLRLWQLGGHPHGDPQGKTPKQRKKMKKITLYNWKTPTRWKKKTCITATNIIHKTKTRQKKNWKKNEKHANKVTQQYEKQVFSLVMSFHPLM